MVMGPKDAVESFFQALQRFGIGRLTAILGAGAGVAAVLASVLLHVGAQPEALLYSNLDLKEAQQITADLDQAGIKYQLKGDGSTVMVDRDSVDKARLLLAGKGLPTAGSVGYEIFDNAPTLGQTEFVQNLDNQRALEGELARTIMKVQGITSARVHLVMPKRELFEDEAGKPTASVLVGLSGSELTGDQVRAIRNLIAGAVPNLKADDVTLLDDRGHALALGGEDDNLSGVDAQHKSEVEESLRKRLQSVVEGIVGPGAARVMVTAQLDPSSVTKEDVEYNPDGQVVRTQQTGETKDGNSEGGTNGATTASANIPGGAAPAGSSGANTSTSSQTTETTQYEISNTKTTTVTAPGEIKKLNVSVAVDDLDIPAKDGKAPDTFQKRPDADMQKIHDLVAAAAGIDTTRGDQLQVINVRFNHNVDAFGLGAKKSMLDFDKNDLMRGAEMAVLVLVALLTIFMVARPLLKFINGGTAGNYLAAANSGGQLAMAAGPAGGHAAGLSAVTAGGSSPLSISGGSGGGIVPVQEQDQRIDIARIEGQVKASSVKKVSEFVDRHPEESLSILRGWLHDA
jgi:flagellar M-ring protein FliF